MRDSWVTRGRLMGDQSHAAPMGNHWTLTGLSKGDPWAAHGGQPVGHEQTLMSFPWATHVWLMANPWVIISNSSVIHGLPMGYPWATRWLPMAYPWATHGLSMDYPWAIHGLPMGYP